MFYKAIIKNLNSKEKEKNVLITGGYGNFGSKISKALLKFCGVKKECKITILGRSREHFEEFLNKESLLNNKISFRKGDVTTDFSNVLEEEKPFLVIHTSGPFGKEDSKLAENCVEYGCHYIDLADNSEFIKAVTSQEINNKAKDKNLYIISGVSSVPGLSSAIVEEYSRKFDRIESLEYSISTASDPVPGESTLRNVLNLIGKPFEIRERIGDNKYRKRLMYNWTGIKMIKYPEVGRRLISIYDVPDIELFPSVDKYPYKRINSIKFYAGLANPMFHIGLVFLSNLVKWHLMTNNFSVKLVKPIQFLANYANLFKTDKSAFHMKITGEAGDKPKSLTFYLITNKGDGMYIPAIPSIVLAKNILGDNLPLLPVYGAHPCIGIVKLQKILKEMESLSIKPILTENI